MTSRALVLILVLLAGAAQAQARPDTLYVNPSLLVSSSRLTALAGASVAIGEGAEGMATNYAAVAQRSPRRTRRWDWDTTFSLLGTPVDSQKDFENDLRPQTSAQPIEAQVGLYLQYMKFGLGGFGRFSTRNLCLDGACSQQLSANTAHGGLVVGGAFWKDQLVIGLGFNVTQAWFVHDAEDIEYTGTSFGVGALLRMHHQPFRLGASFLLGHVGRPTTPTSQIADRPLFAGISTPHKISVGASVRLGPGSERYNRVSQSLVDEQPKYEGAPVLPFDPDHDVPPGTWLLSAQLDLVLPVSNATTVRSFLFGEPPVPAGASFYVVPRLGVEHELLPKRLRLRTGAWLEPNLVRGSQLRPHVTFGFEVFTLHLIDDWSISAALDAAPRYFAASVGIGWWR
ncbi:MAG: hypothetical protein H6Q89_1931 [Myxococcaceae bacterium]|nr:hypothetical protein [Myxococcaceae bacterium]